MTTATATPTSADLPIEVHDRRRRGFFMIDNEVIDHYGAQLKPTGIATYTGLARFANREGECFPSQTTLAKRLGMSRMQVNREIKKLEQLHLIEVKPQFGPHGEQRANLYILLDVPKDEEPIKHRYTPCNSRLHPPVTASDTPCNRQLSKQNTTKKKQTEQDSEQQKAVVVAEAIHALPLAHEPKLDNTPPIKENGDENSLSAALLTLGLAEGVVRDLVQTYSRARILEKIAYLKFLQAAPARKIHNPRGWLRRAIEENYGPPDGYIDQEEQAQQQQALQVNEEYLNALAMDTEQKRRKQLAEKAARAAYRQSLHTQYGTTEADQQIWQEVQRDISYRGRRDIHALIADAEILKRTETSVLIGIVHEDQLRQLSHPGIQMLIKRAFMHLVHQPLVLEFVLLPEFSGDSGALH